MAILTRFILALIAAATFVAASPALARDWPTVAGWDIVEGDEYCGMSLEYEGKGDTVLTVGKYLDGHALVIVTNYGWSAKKGELYDLEFFVGDQQFGGAKSLGTGESYERKGFATQFGADFFPAFAAGSSFKVYMGDTLVDSLKLSGSAAASVVVDRCLSGLRALRAAAERERQRFAHIPDDSFAGAKRAATAPVGDPTSWVTMDDYPPSAIRDRSAGTTTVDLSVNTEGRITDCIVSKSSGSAALDQAACRAMQRRGRFQPAIDETGNPTTAVVTHSVNWSLPIAP